MRTVAAASGSGGGASSSGLGLMAGGLGLALQTLRDLLVHERGPAAHLALRELTLVVELVDLLTASSAGSGTGTSTGASGSGLAGVQLVIDPLLFLPAKVAGKYAGIVIRGETQSNEALVIGGRCDSASPFIRTRLMNSFPSLF
jgi:hypothetical protein